MTEHLCRSRTTHCSFHPNMSHLLQCGGPGGLGGQREPPCPRLPIAADRRSPPGGSHTASCPQWQALPACVLVVGRTER